MKKSTIGLAPGTLLSDSKGKETEIYLLTYAEEGKIEKKINDIAELVEELKSEGIHWIQFRGVGNVSIIEKLGEIFKISTLVLEDILNPYHRPKAEFLGEYDFITFRRYFTENKKINSEQLNLIVLEKVLISFQHTTDNIFSSLADRFAARKQGRLLFHGTSYLAYAIIDYILDQYLFVQEYFEEQTEQLSNEVHASTHGRDVKERLYSLRTGLFSFRKAVFPMAEMTERLLKHPDYSEGEQRITIYLQDLHDHVLHTQDFVRTYNETLEGLSAFFFSITADKTNQIMQMLTVITIIFLPLTLLAGIYGMNFQHMPELEWKYAYPALITVMLTIAISIYTVFKRNKWL